MSNMLAFLFSFAITLVIGGVLRRADTPLTQTGFGVASLEVARSPEQSALILGRYQAVPGGLQVLRHGLLLDSTLFIPAYTLSLVLGCRLAAAMFRSHGLDLCATAGEVFQFWAVLAGCLDYLENLGLYRQAASGASVFWWRWTFATSLAKWLIIGLILLYGLAALASFAFLWLTQGRVARA
jgi:hypothetical protein